ncbi:E3 ubiquitin-protein ligase TRIM33-like [Mytilus californianus]|uniref:E3 ubiquitin-protein ligase TRIM33-like n=1 Tax=Mytilus californianus TaxID=6549 RepID=UPI0022482321|nr:E3 ubiquitin-protein ligase TRIM33-like [Mytilus californianus]
MAFSQSIGKAQTPAMCQFCEESPEIKWKCINCELFLCNLCCSKIHSKSKASMDHEIINLKDIDTENFAKTMRKVDLQNLQCTIHSNQKCFIYCKDCSEPVCSKCLTETHKMHDYREIDEVYNKIISEMKELIDTFESNLKFFTNERDRLEIKLSDGDKKFQETRNIILQTEKEMKEAISKYANDLLQDLDAKWKLSENMIKIELSALKQNGDELEIRKKNLYQALQTHQVTDIFSTTQTLDKSLPKYSVKQFKQSETQFIPNSRQVKIGSNILGDLYSVPDFELIKKYQSNNKSVTNILFCDDNTALIGSIASRKLQQVKFENDNTKVERDVEIIVNDMEKTQDGKVIVSFGESDLKLYTSDGTFKTFMAFTPLKTLGVHVTKNNNVIVGLSDSLEVIDTENSIRRLVVMNLNGDLQHTIEYDKDNQRLLSWPYRIKTLNDKIVVVEFLK